ncbi:MAG: hypothetical protein VB027_10930 [Gordonibacter sp.]|nr:hypothetical protein [Gordonibacter sp.]
MNSFVESLLKEKPDYDSKVLLIKDEIASILLALDPLEVMLHSMWYMRMICAQSNMQEWGSDESRLDSEPLTELEENNALIVPEYLQSLLINLPKSEVTLLEDKNAIESAHAKLFDKCEELVNISNVYKLMEFAETFPERSVDDTESAIQDFQVEASLYEAIRGKRYQILEETYLDSLISAQDKLIQEIYGISASDVVRGVIALRDSLCLGWNDVIQQFDELFEAWQHMDQGDTASLDQIRDQCNASGIAENMFGSGLFDVAKITGWPNEIIDDLSRPAFPEIGAKDLAREISPIGILPIRNYPFISIGEKTYCFCYANLMDNFYRAFYAATRRRNQSDAIESREAFVNEWKESQATASEGAVASLLGKLLPSATIYQNIYHPKKGVTYSKKASQESDLVVVFDDCALAIEVKAGSYCPTDPMEDREGHVKSFRTLIEKAAKQARSTVDYLRRCALEALFYDKDGNVIARIDSSSIREYFCICVTIDDINEFATRAEKLAFIDVEPGTIAVSIDDFFVYERYFDNPLVFLHFLMQRRRASEHERIEFNDELDHLGMYIDNNCYSVTIDNLFKEQESRHGLIHKAMYDGCRDDLNRWFEGLFVGKDAEKPVQSNPEEFDRLIEALGNSKASDRRFMACSLLDLGSEDREAIAKTMRARALGFAPPNCLLCFPGASTEGDTRACLFACPTERPNDVKVMRAKVIAALLSNENSDAVVMNAVYDALILPRFS